MTHQIHRNSFYFHLWEDEYSNLAHTKKIDLVTGRKPEQIRIWRAITCPKAWQHWFPSLMKSYKSYQILLLASQFLVSRIMPASFSEARFTQVAFYPTIIKAFWLAQSTSFGLSPEIFWLNFRSLWQTLQIDHTSISF